MKLITAPLVSVIIPAYNHEKYIQETILSIINQTYNNIELLIIDDGSSDLSYDKICELESRCRKRFVRFEFLKQENMGIIDTLNTLINMSAGEYVFLTASDDIVAPHAIETELSFLANNSDYALCVGGNDIIDENSQRCFFGNIRRGNIVYNTHLAKYLSYSSWLKQYNSDIKLKTEDFGLYYNIVYYGSHNPNGYLIRKSIFEKTGLYIKEAPTEDHWMNIQIAKHSKMKYLNDTLFYYRWHSTNSVKSKARFWYTYKTILYELQTSFPEIEELKDEKWNKIPENREEDLEAKKNLRDIFYRHYKKKNNMLDESKNKHFLFVSNKLISDRITPSLVSVLIPAYNHEKYIQETIISIINQTYKNIELLIIDDGSTDSTYDKICELESQCRKRFVRFEFGKQENMGIIDTLNTLIGMSSGGYIYLIASDDVAAPHAIETEFDFLVNNPDYALCVGNNDLINTNSGRCFFDEHNKNIYDISIAHCYSFSDSLMKNIPDIDFYTDDFGSYNNLVCYGNHIPNGYLIRKSIFQKIGLYNKEAPLEDYWIMLQIAKHAKMKYLRDTLFFYRWHEKNMINNTPKYYLTYKTLLYELMTKYPEDKKLIRCNKKLEQWKEELEQSGEKSEMTSEEYEVKIGILRKIYINNCKKLVCK
jgi:alpha-1,3-rhamnosyltransferase